jgi:hypothetical protein
MRRREFLIGAAGCASVRAADGDNTTWTLENDRIAVTYAWSGQGWFHLASLLDKRTTRVWRAPETSPGVLRLGGTGGLTIGPETVYALPAVSQEEVASGGRRLTFRLQPLEVSGEIILQAEVYPGRPFLRQRWFYKNLSSRAATLTSAAFLNVSLQAENQRFRAFRVNQWVDGGKRGNFETEQTELGPLGEPWLIASGSFAQHCAWAAMRDSRNNGLVLGWEFNGRAQVWLEHNLADASLQLTGFVTSLSHPLGPGQTFEAPACFLGSFRGDWDEAGYQTQRFTEAALAAPMPDSQKFPYVAWDSWGYEDQIDENLLRRAADVASRLGVELLLVDLGWARRLGDWEADPRRFPSGMRALSDYVHARGMKFGLHLPFLEADPASAILRANPDWTASTSDDFYGARSLCPGHEPAKQWIVSEVLRVVREYGVDWILQDGVNPVKVCTKRTHTHNARNSNYANSVQGLDEILAAIRRQAPDVVVENCQSGGRMMTFQMVQACATSITCDDSSALTTRQAIHGATYPFSPRYADRYTGDELVTKYNLRSGMFGGPWMLMQRITGWREADIALAAAEITLYKSLRPIIRDGKVFHLTPRPNGLRNEAIQAYSARLNRSVILVFRNESEQDSLLVRPRGLLPTTDYRIRLQDAATIQIAAGRDLMERGVDVPLPDMNSAEIVLLTPASVDEVYSA